MKNLYVWSKDDFRLTLQRLDYPGKPERASIRYSFKDNGKVIFEGSDFSIPAFKDLDISVVMSLLGFLSLKPGDTDSEYFDKYTPEQIAWRDSSRCDDLSLIVSDFEG